jgi:hypothetical protein
MAENLIAMPLLQLAVPFVPSLMARCFRCRAEVWVCELAGRPLIDRGGMAICMPCLGQVNGPAKIEDDGQIAEAEAWVRHDAPHLSGHLISANPAKLAW